MNSPTGTLNEAVTATIRAELARSDTSHGDFARACGWNAMYFSRRMAGHIPWSTQEIEIIAKQLAIPVTELTNPVQR